MALNIIEISKQKMKRLIFSLLKNKKKKKKKQTGLALVSQIQNQDQTF